MKRFSFGIWISDLTLVNTTATLTIPRIHTYTLGLVPGDEGGMTGSSTVFLTKKIQWPLTPPKKVFCPKIYDLVVESLQKKKNNNKHPHTHIHAN